jgi:hypothetical protein
MTKKRYLFYIAHNYAFEILRPLQEVILSQEDEVMWLPVGKEIQFNYFLPEDNVLACIDDARAYNPQATFAPGNEIPHFIPGLKVQIFHGLEWKKKGHFVIRDFFDLYCTQGPATTGRFNQLKDKHGFFDVVETGWSKLDTLFNAEPLAIKNNGKKVILYAPTFSPNLTSAPALFDKIKALNESKQYHWIVKFHPKMAKDWVEKYKQLENKHFEVIETASINNILQAADIMVSDTSSVIGEFSLLNKATVSLNNKTPGNYLVNIQNDDMLEAAIAKALTPTPVLSQNIKDYADDIHPYRDGRSAQRILMATENMIENGKLATRSKPLNLFRNLKQRRKLGYWRP